MPEKRLVDITPMQLTLGRRDAEALLSEEDQAVLWHKLDGLADAIASNPDQVTRFREASALLIGLTSLGRSCLTVAAQAGGVSRAALLATIADAVDEQIASAASARGGG